MNGEENFKKSLNDRLNAKDFPFEESHWQEAEKFIAAARRKRRIRPLLWILPAIFIGGASLLFIGEDSTQQIAVNPPTLTTPETQPSAVVKQAQEKTSQNAPDQVSSPAIPTNTKKLPEKPEAKSIDEPAKEIKTANAPAISDPHPSPEKNTTPVNNHEQPASEKIPVTVLASDKTPSKSKEETPMSSNEETLTPSKEKSANVDPAVVPHSETPALPTPKNETGVTGDDQKTEAAKTAATSAEMAATQTSSQNNQDPETAPTTNSAAVVVLNADEEAQKAAQTSAPVVTEKTEAALPDTDYVALKRPLLTIEAGANIARGWNSGEKSEASGVNPLIGINYFHNLSEELGISAGLQYYSIGNLKASTYTSRITRYGHGEQSEVSVFTPTRLHYLAMPLQVNYNFGSSNMVGVGVNIAYLLTVDVKLEQYTESINGTTTSRVSKDRGYMEGFRPFDNQICLFYRRRFLTHAFVGTELYYGLNPIKSSFFNATGQERNMGLKLTLGYYLLKSK